MKTNDLLSLGKDIRQYLEEERERRQLTFVEEEHKYGIYNPMNESIVTDYPSVSTLMKKYSIPFDEVTKSIEMCKGNEEKAANLRAEWKEKGDYAGSVGSYAHYKLENYLLELFDIEKDTRKPEYDLDEKGLGEGQSMVKTGVNLMHIIIEKGFVPLDTEVIMGSNDLGYFGQCDNMWLGFIKDQVVLLMTDHKTNQTKNFAVRPWNVPMFAPFEYLLDTDLNKYYLQQPLYALLFNDMLKNSPFSHIPFAGFRILHLRGNGNIHKIPMRVYEDIRKLYLPK